MRYAMLFSLIVVLVVATSNQGDDKTPKEPAKEAAKPSKDSYVKIRVEVEIRGLLVENDKGITVTALDRVYDLFHPNGENSDWSLPAAYTLDFTRAKDLRALAKVLNDKEVVVVGMAEVRRLVNSPRKAPGGSSGPNFPTFTVPVPGWYLQQTVIVTSLRSAENNK
jgi:hypothetical protein